MTTTNDNGMTKGLSIQLMSCSNECLNSVTIEDVLRRRQLLSKSRHCLLWALINGMFVSLLAIDIQYSIMGSLFDWKAFHNLVMILDLMIGSILLVNVFYDFGLWFWRKYLMTQIILTSNQMKAFGVKSHEIGFKECKPITASSNDSTLNTSIGSISPVFEMSYTSELDGHSSLNSTHLSLANSSILSNSLNGGHNSSLNSTATSWQYNPTSSPISDPINDSNGVLRRRLSNRINYIQPIVTNERQLNQYLQDFDVKEKRFEELSDSEKCSQTNTTTSLWNSPNNCPQEESQQITYRIAIDSPLRLNSADLDSVNTSATSSKAMDSLLAKLKINEILVNQWIENIRKWLSQTIICRLIDQIDKTNETLIKSGHFDVAHIGETSVESLKQLSVKKPQLSNVDSILPFLHITTNQEYLVQRIRDLSKGGCIGKFIWNSGGSYKLKPWSEQMLTDSAIVMHLLRTYMDLRLPSDPNSPEGKAFTNYYFQSMTGPVPKSSVYILEVNINPPHYKVFSEGDGLWELPIGRNNLFHAILVFLDIIKNKQMGHLGRINLGSSGLNILWVINR